jgi:hypothetical protein
VGEATRGGEEVTSGAVRSVSLFEGCRGDACANPAVVKVSRAADEFVPLCLSCLPLEIQQAGFPDREVALQRRSGDRLDGLVPVVEVLASASVADPLIRLGLARDRTPVADVADDVTWPADGEPERCGFESCTSGAIASVNPMLRSDDTVRACKRHLVPTVMRTPNPEVRPEVPSMLPHVAEALAVLAENIFAVQIFFESAGVEGLETSCAEDGSRVSTNELHGERPFLIF